jgi:hypothetical protein
VQLLEDPDRPGVHVDLAAQQTVPGAGPVREVQVVPVFPNERIAKRQKLVAVSRLSKDRSP